MIVVTGAAGFIGSNIVKGLNDRGVTNILCVDNLKKSEKHLNLNKLRYLDFVDKEEFPHHLHELEGVEAIIHQGACSDTMETDGRYMMENNYDYSKMLLHHCIDTDTRFIYASSASVYGSGDCGFTEKEDCEYPLNIYAFSKFSFDNYVRSLSSEIEQKGTQVVGLRYFNVYGPQENHKGRMASVAFHMFNQYKENGTMKLFEGSENIVRDFVYVKDVVDVNIFFFENPDKSGIFNCGTGKAESFCGISDAVQKKYPDAKLEFIDFPEKLKGKYQMYTQADVTKLREAGFERSFKTLSEGVADYLEILEATGGYLK